MRRHASDFQAEHEVYSLLLQPWHGKAVGVDVMNPPFHHLHVANAAGTRLNLSIVLVCCRISMQGHP